MQRPSVPPPEKIDQKLYSYDPIPMDEPVMPADLFIHYFNKETTAHTEPTWFTRFPQKLGTSLFYNTKPLAEGWGIEIAEGPNWFLVITGMVVAVFLSGVVAGAYAYSMKDNATGVAIGAWLTALQTLIAAALFFRWTSE